MGRRVTAAVSTLNQWALDFSGNLKRILQSIEIAKKSGATIRSGPELEICGYSCEDHFFESDTLLHSWQSLLELLKSPICNDILIDVGMPVMHRNIVYNCRIAFFNEKILLIRPKMILCDDGCYREQRWFSKWSKKCQYEDHYLPRIISNFNKQITVPFGDAVIATQDTCIGFEICEELWNPKSPHIDMALDGVEIFINGSASYTELRKSYVTFDLVKSATMKSGGCYLFSNLRGCDGQRIYFHGCSCVALNGQLLERSKQFTLNEVEVTTATFDLEEVRTYRNYIRSRSHLAASKESEISYPRINVDFRVSVDIGFLNKPLSMPIEVIYLNYEEEICQGPACWLWDYLRRSGQGGFFLPLSGGLDSCCVAAIVYSMCNMLLDAVQANNQSVLNDLRRILGKKDYIPTSVTGLCKELLFTCYMATKKTTSNESKNRSKNFANEINSNHVSCCIQIAIDACVSIFSSVTSLIPRFSAFNGTPRENLALQNIQARLRMVLSYFFAQLLLLAQNRPGGLLVLGSSNADEALVGYMTKYDCSSADLNPIGSLSKNDLKSFLRYFNSKYKMESVKDILEAVPTAELEPLGDDRQLLQTDEDQIGLTYKEIGLFSLLRKKYCCGPFSMYCRLVDASFNHDNEITIQEKDQYPEQIANKVKLFFRRYAINRHKMTTLTPSYHAECYSPDDNRFDHRPFLYRVDWETQFNAIDKQVAFHKTLGKVV